MVMPLPQPHAYTADDYWGLPDGERAELIDGTLYGMTPPGRRHQRISSELNRTLGNHIAEHAGSCQVYAAPFAVNLNADDSTWVEPDLVVICDPSKLSDRGCEGAPDLVIEIVSPSSQRMDYIIKPAKYERAGVREYWIVDPATRQTMVFRFDTDNPTPRTYPFDEAVEVGIWDGLSITMSEFE